MLTLHNSHRTRCSPFCLLLLLMLLLLLLSNSISHSCSFRSWANARTFKTHYYSMLIRAHCRPKFVHKFIFHATFNQRTLCAFDWLFSRLVRLCVCVRARIHSIRPQRDLEQRIQIFVFVSWMYTLANYMHEADLSASIKRFACEFPCERSNSLNAVVVRLYEEKNTIGIDHCHLPNNCQVFCVFVCVPPHKCPNQRQIYLKLKNRIKYSFEITVNRSHAFNSCGKTIVC